MQNRGDSKIFEGFDRFRPVREAKTIFEGAKSDDSELSAFADKQLRSQAMSLALVWLSLGDYSYDALLSLATGMADMDQNEELDDDEQAYLNDLLAATGGALAASGATPANVSEFLEKEDDAAGLAIGEYLSYRLENTARSDEDIIADYAVSGDVILEGVFKAIRDGVVSFVKKRIGRPKKMSAAQKVALKKARSRAFTGAAKKKRAKSMKRHMKAGL